MHSCLNNRCPTGSCSVNCLQGSRLIKSQQEVRSLWLLQFLTLHATSCPASPLEHIINECGVCCDCRCGAALLRLDKPAADRRPLCTKGLWRRRCHLWDGDQWGCSLAELRKWNYSALHSEISKPFAHAGESASFSWRTILMIKYEVWAVISCSIWEHADKEFLGFKCCSVQVL